MSKAQKKQTEQPTLASVMRELLSKADSNGSTPRHKLCDMMINRALDGDADALAWVERVSGDPGEESRRVEKLTSPFTLI